MNNVEIERKFLVHRELMFDVLVKSSRLVAIMQGYISDNPAATIRVRHATTLNLLDSSEKPLVEGFLTTKGISVGAARSEYEDPINPQHASVLLESCKTHIIKNRWVYTDEYNQVWEIDTLFGVGDEHMIIAEIELESEDQEVTLPAWISTEVTTDPRYYNSNLAKPNENYKAALPR